MILIRDRKITKEFKSALFSIYIKQTGVLVIDVNCETTYDVNEVKQIISQTQKMAEGKKFLVLVKTNPLAVTTFEALRLLAGRDANYAHAKAYVITSISQRMMANFFLHYFKPKVPVKFFKEPLSAEVWLLRTHRYLLRP